MVENVQAERQTGEERPIGEPAHGPAVSFEEQFDTLRRELRKDLDKLQATAVSLGLGTSLIAISGILGTLMVVRLLNRSTGLPLWASYGLVGGLLGTAGAALLSGGVQEASTMRVIPKMATQTAQSLKKSATAVEKAAEVMAGT